LLSFYRHFIKHPIHPGGIMPFDASNLFPMDPYDLADAIDMPLKEWPLNCHGVACAVRDLTPVEGMRVARGHFTGAVARNSAYRRGVLQHSWLELEDGRILDPTRWAMECPDRPYIYLGVCDHYDDGGRALTACMPPVLSSKPTPDLTQKIGSLCADDQLSLAKALGQSAQTVEQLFGLVWREARADPSQIPDPSVAYMLMERAGLKALIPIDSWDRVMRMEHLKCKAGSNRLFSLPPQEPVSNRALITELLRHFVTVEQRGDHLDAELCEYEISLEEYYDALNRLIDNPDLPLTYFTSSDQYILGIVVSDLLGQGYGNKLRVERYARSMGHSQSSLNNAIREIGAAFGMHLLWD
jgi:hypothetical protein